MKKKLKKTLKSLGLLPLLDWLLRSFSISNIISILIGLKYYFYNYWLTYFPVYGIRLLYLRHILGVKIGKESFVHMGCFFEDAKTIIGSNSVIGRNCYLGGGVLTIKNNVSITAQTYIFCSTHFKDSPTFKCINKNVTIEDHAWIGARAMVLPGVNIGKGSILGASSVATKDIPDYTVYAGVPAKRIGNRSKNLTYRLKYFPSLQ